MSRERDIDRATPSGWRASCPMGDDPSCGLTCEGRAECTREAERRAAIYADLRDDDDDE